MIALIIVAVISKIIGCYLPAKLSGMSSNEAITVGVGMVPRGEVGMIVGVIGLTSGAISQSIYVSIIIMSIVTTLITPAALRKFFNKILGNANSGFVVDEDLEYNERDEKRKFKS